MKYASFSKLGELELFASVGFDGVELDSCELRRLDDAQFSRLRSRLGRLGLEVCACSWIMENTVHICDPAFDRRGWLERFRKDAERLSQLDCPVMVFAAGPIRTVGRGAGSAAKAESINGFIRDTAQVFAERGVKLALETVCGDYTDYLMRLSQSAELCEEPEKSNIWLLTDIRHLVRAGDEPDDILRYAELIIHAHIDDPIGIKRLAPLPQDGYSYEFFLRRVLKTRAGWISFECHDEPDWPGDGPVSLAYVRALVDKLKREDQIS